MLGKERNIILLSFCFLTNGAVQQQVDFLAWLPHFGNQKQLLWLVLSGLLCHTMSLLVERFRSMVVKIVEIDVFPGWRQTELASFDHTRSVLLLPLTRLLDCIEPI